MQWCFIMHITKRQFTKWYIWLLIKVLNIVEEFILEDTNLFIVGSDMGYTKNYFPVKIVIVKLFLMISLTCSVFYIWMVIEFYRVPCCSVFPSWGFCDHLLNGNLGWKDYLNFPAKFLILSFQSCAIKCLIF